MVFRVTVSTPQPHTPINVEHRSSQHNQCNISKSISIQVALDSVTTWTDSHKRQHYTNRHSPDHSRMRNTEHCNVHCQVSQGPYLTDRLKLPDQMSGSNMHMRSSHLTVTIMRDRSTVTRVSARVSSESLGTSASATTPKWHQSSSACPYIYIDIYIYI